MALNPQIERALDIGYEAVLRPAAWTGALDSLAASLGGSGCHIISHDAADRIALYLPSTHMGRWAELWDLNSEWVTDTCAQRGTPFVRRGCRSLLQGDIFTDEEVASSRFHREIADPAGCLHWASASFRIDGDAWCMPVYRMTPFTRQDTCDFVAVSYHLQRMMRLRTAFEGTRDAMHLAALEHVGSAALLIGRDGRIIGANALAEQLMCEDFRVRGGRLAATGENNQARIDRLIQAVRGALAGDLLEAPMALITRDGVPWLALDTLPLSRSLDEPFGGARAVIVVRNLAANGSPSVESLRAIYGLTASEARLAVALCRRFTLDDAAREFGVGKVTLKSHLKSVFAKTGTRRQAELVALLSGLH
jgi:DNA-binding CsgD family transcriptional regulator